MLKATVSPSTYSLRPQRLIVAISLFVLAAGAIALSQYGWKHTVLFLIGGLLGMTLYHSSFGFASAYRKLLAHREVSGIYAQLVMLAITTILFAPVLASGSVWGQSVRGSIAPIGVQGAIGAFLFGVGMQLGGACGCGTLYTIGGGSLTMLLTLLTFCMGAFAASLTRQFWGSLPALQPIVLGSAIGWPGAVVVQLVLFGLLAVLLRWWSRGKVEGKRQESGVRSQESGGAREQRSRGEPFLPASPHPPLPSSPTPPSSPSPPSPSLTPLLHGPWPLIAGAIALAVLNWLTLLLSGQPWRITWGFALWAAQVARQLGWDASSSPFWSSEASQKVLSQTIFADVSSIMNMGIILGAILAAALAGKWVAQGERSKQLIFRTLLGGLMMGYGAFLAFGCNVNAFFGGIASTSVHGWVWIIFALLGTALGIQLRKVFQAPG